MIVTLLVGLGAACAPSGAPPLECSEVDTSSGQSSGYQLCGGTAVERQAAEACTSSDADHSFACVTVSDACAADEDCEEPGEGTCVEYYDGCYCGRTSCLSDDDCGAGFACICHEVQDESLDPWGMGDRLTGRNACVPAECRSNTDCSAGQSCRLSRGSESCCDAANYNGFFCTTSDDSCRSDADCAGGGGCIFDEAQSKWACGTWQCACD